VDLNGIYDGELQALNKIELIGDLLKETMMLTVTIFLFGIKPAARAGKKLG
jgi:hypothetical protein